MTDRPKVKLCWNCEGHLELNQENCPYCGVYVSPIEGSGSSEPVTPPYQVEEKQDTHEEVPPSPYHTEQQEVTTPQPEVSVKVAEHKELKKQAIAEGITLVLTPMLLLVSGSLFFFFSLVLLLFSQDGIFTLKWNADHWYLYLTVSLLMLFFGWKTLHRIEEE